MPARFETTARVISSNGTVSRRAKVAAMRRSRRSRLLACMKVMGLKFIGKSILLEAVIIPS
ncbi:hypothetical protein D3C71_1892410 [compost metagenome]